MAAVAGVDVGAEPKGFHAVVLHPDGTVVRRRFRGPPSDDLADWLGDEGVQAVAVDAPCRWRAGPGVRPAERALHALRLPCFWTPTEAVGTARACGGVDRYAWMRNGLRLYEALAPAWPLLATPDRPPGRFSCETYPHAVAAALVEAEPSWGKRRTRTAALRAARVATDDLPTVDDLDAALCAVTARSILAGTARAVGRPDDGWILFPDGTPSPRRGRRPARPLSP